MLIYSKAETSLLNVMNDLWFGFKVFYSVPVSKSAHSSSVETTCSVPQESPWTALGFSLRYCWSVFIYMCLYADDISHLICNPQLQRACLHSCLGESPKSLQFYSDCLSCSYLMFHLTHFTLLLYFFPNVPILYKVIISIHILFIVFYISFPQWYSFLIVLN